jgi:ankyrin repeat protein
LSAQPGTAISLRGTGISTYDQEMKGATAFLISAYYNCDEFIRLLMEKGANINERRKLDGRTALMLAIEKGNTGMVKLLIDSGADLNALDAKGTSPLALAMGKKNPQIQTMLKNAGAR